MGFSGAAMPPTASDNRGLLEALLGDGTFLHSFRRRPALGRRDPGRDDAARSGRAQSDPAGGADGACAFWSRLGRSLPDRSSILSRGLIQKEPLKIK